MRQPVSRHGGHWRHPVTVAVVAAASLIVPVIPASAQNTPSADVLHGRVVLPDGSPASGATVALWAIANQAPAGPHRDAPIATTTADDNGEFNVRIRLTDRLVYDVVIPNRDVLNMRIVATDYVKVNLPDDMPVPPAGDPTVGATGTLYSTVDALYGVIEFTGAPEGADNALGAVLSIPKPATLELQAVSLLGGVMADPGAWDDSKCNMHVPPITETLGEQVPFEPIGELHTGYDTTGKLYYGATANSDLGAAYSINSGKWSATAEANRLRNAESTVWTEYGSTTRKVVGSQFLYRKTRSTWTYMDDGQEVTCRVDEYVTPIEWAGVGMSAMRDAAHDRDDWAMDYYDAEARGWHGAWEGKGGWEKNRGTGKKYTAEVQAFGVKIHATTTWNSYTKIVYEFGTGTLKPHHLFGSDGPLNTASVAYAY